LPVAERQLRDGKQAFPQTDLVVNIEDPVVLKSPLLTAVRSTSVLGHDKLFQLPATLASLDFLAKVNVVGYRRPRATTR
jgi:hypothetical protein